MAFQNLIIVKQIYLAARESEDTFDDAIESCEDAVGDADATRRTDLKEVD